MSYLVPRQTSEPMRADGEAKRADKQQVCRHRACAALKLPSDEQLLTYSGWVLNTKQSRVSYCLISKWRSYIVIR